MDQASSISQPATVVGSDERLSDLERILMVIPLLGGAVFGILPYFLTTWFANISGFPGNDHFIYRIAGAATFAYAIGLAGALMDGRWITIRPLVAATLVFNIGSLIACLTAMLGGKATTVVYLILVTSILILAITAYLFNNHRAVPSLPTDVAQYAVTITIVALVLAAATGVAALFLPNILGPTFGYKATDIFVYQQAGAATLGTATMGLMQLRSRAWAEWCWAAVLALVFNGLAFLASIFSIYKSAENSIADPIALPIIIGLASLGVTIASLLIIQRQGK